MIAAISAMDKPTDWVNLIMCNIKETPEGKFKIRLCLDPRDLRRNICQEHYYTRNIDELLLQLHGKKFSSVVNTKKGYWHVALAQPNQSMIKSSAKCSRPLANTMSA